MRSLATLVLRFERSDRASSRRAGWVASLASLALLACDPVASPAYRGEALLETHGMVVGTSSTSGAARVGVLWLIRDGGRVTSLLSSETSAALERPPPVEFDLAIRSLPPADAVNAISDSARPFVRGLFGRDLDSLACGTFVTLPGPGPVEGALALEALGALAPEVLLVHASSAGLPGGYEVVEYDGLAKYEQERCHSERCAPRAGSDAFEACLEEPLPVECADATPIYRALEGDLRLRAADSALRVEMEVLARRLVWALDR